MTKLSDSLRSAADRAPVGDATVNVDSVAGRVRLQRGMRTGANGIVGAGAVAVLAFGVATPFLGNLGANANGADLAAESARAPEGAFATSEDAAGTRLADWGTCGTYPLEWLEETGGFAASSSWEGGEFDGGELVEVPVTVVGGEPGDYYTSGPIAVVLWDGMVVATAAPSVAMVEEFTNGDDPIEGVAVNELLNCHTGEPLPAQKYELVVSQQFTQQALPPVASAEPTPGAPAEPAASEPAPAASEDSAGGDAASSGLVGEDAVDPEADGAPEPDFLPGDEAVTVAQYRAVAEPIPFTIAGEPVEDPFGEFMPEPWTPPVLPEGALTPSTARELIAAAMTDSRWTMAAGTSRVVPAWGYDAEADADSERRWFGCSWDGNVTSFPTPSAELNLLDARVDAPSSINVSYGWIVDGNPEVSVTLTNSSGYSLPGFHGEPGLSLYLVDASGTVVAEGYPTSLNRNGGVAYAEDAAARSDAEAATSSLLLPAADDGGYLEPGESISGEYVWRDINGCWTEAGQQDVAAGTYTLVSARHLYLQEWGEGDVERPTTEPAIGPDDSPELSEDAVAIDPYYAQEDWLELQVWTSHGTVRVTTS